MDNLIQIHNNTLPSNLCKFIISKFEESNNLIDGLTGGGVNKTIKDSKDLMIHDMLQDKDWEYIYNYLMENLVGNFIEYLRKNPFIFINSQFSSEASLIRTASSAFRVSNGGMQHLQMQRYIGDQGYHTWHFENEGGATSNRDVFFIYYLNDVDGGSTEFKFNPQEVTPKEGTLLLAPAYWTHMHKGNPPKDNQTKYIITGWIERNVVNIGDEFQEDFYI
jgi:hypothetical protein